MNLSRAVVARFALRYVRKPKTRKRFAEALNLKIDLPGLDEEQEAALFESTVGIGLDAVEAALTGGNMVSALSNRAACRTALGILRDELLELGTEEVDLPGVPDWIENPAANALADFIDAKVLPWVDTTSRLQ